MKLLQRFRKQPSREDMEAQAAQELDAAMAKPVDIPAMTPAPGLPGDDLNGSGTVETGETGDNGEAPESVTDRPKRRSAPVRKAAATKAPATRTRSAATKADSAKPAGGSAKVPVRKPVAKPAAKKTSAAAAGGTAKKRASTGAADNSTGRARTPRRAAAKKG